jgi:peptidoglycan/LPS O-acetylase OafA/YrhL
MTMTTTNTTHALSGLRGLASLHVAISHIVRAYTKIDIMGAGSMGIFFLLSGYLLMLGYRKRPPLPNTNKSFFNDMYARVMGWIGLTAEMDAASFLWKRVWKLLPMYYIAILLGAVAVAACFPMFLARTTSLQWILTGLVATSWFPPMTPAGNLTTWSISTMMFFYVMFPAVAPWISNHQKPDQLAKRLYPLQAFLVLAMVVPLV